MKKLSIISFFLIGTSASAQLLPATSSDSCQVQLVSKIKESFCGAGTYGSESRRQMLTSETKLLRFYPFISCDFTKYRYEENVMDFLEINTDFFYYAFNGTWEVVDTLIGTVVPINFDSCYYLEQDALQVPAEYFKILAPVLSKIDLKTTSIFMLPVRQTKVYLLSKGKVFVIDDDKIVPFQQYFQSRYSIKQFREEFDGRM